MGMILWHDLPPFGGLESRGSEMPSSDLHAEGCMAAPPKTDNDLFRELVETILGADDWSSWRQDANAAVEWSAPAFKLKGLLRIVDGAREWWPYQVDMHRLRKEGPDAIARDFMKQYEQQRVLR